MSTNKLKKNTSEESTNEDAINTQPPMCGIVMPIAGFDGYPETHWKEVLSILKDSAAEAGFNANLVSHAEESGIIQKRIIENLYKNEMVICDISGKNANVMLELGIRLAFDKPTIVIMDDATSFSFDITPMEHIIYRRDLRFHSVLDFRGKLKAKIEATYEKATKKTLVGFIKSFGDFEAVKINEKEVSSEKFLFDRLNEIEKLIIKHINNNPQTIYPKGFIGTATTLKNNVLRVTTLGIDRIRELQKELLDFPFVLKVSINTDPANYTLLTAPETATIDVEFSGSENEPKIVRLISSYGAISSVLSF